MAHLERSRLIPAVRAVLALLIAGAGAPAVAGAQASHAQRDSAFISLLQTLGGIRPEELSVLDHGGVVVRSLDVPDRDEVALLGVVGVDVPHDFYVARRRAPAGLALSGSSAPRNFSAIHEPPTLDDFASLTFDESEASGIRKCAPSRCTLKLPRDVMATVKDAVDWAAPAAPQVSGALRQWLLNVVREYLKRGDAALPVYDDTRPAESSAAGFHQLLAEDAPILRDAPPFAEYLGGTPSRIVPGAASVLYWMVDRRAGPKPLLSVAQQSTYESSGSAALTFMATKQLYASHYLDAFLDLETIGRGSPTEGSTPVVIVRRFRFDHLPSRGLFDVRGRIVRRLRDAFRDELTSSKRALELAYSGAHE